MSPRNTFLTCLLVAVTLPAEAGAGTYNFYFNNTEQGPNGEAKPSLVIDDGKKDAATEPVVEEVAEEGTSPESPASVPEAPPAQSTARAEPPAPSGHRMWRVGAFLSNTRWGRADPDPWQRGGHQRYSARHSYYDSSSTREESKYSQSAASFSATFLPTPYLGLTALLGSIKGVEAELNLLPSNALITFGFLLGYGKTKVESASSVFWGMQAGLDFGDLVGLQLTWRDMGGVDAVKASSLGAYVKF